MDDAEVGRYWEGNAAAWTALSRAGFDRYRDEVNTPAFLAMLPPVDGLSGIDIGCGEGTNTRSVARLGARMTGIDIAPTFVAAARDVEEREPLGIRYELCSAQELPFADGFFDFGTAFMSLMDVPDSRRALREASRVIQPGGFFQFSILHPCFGLRDRKVIKDANGRHVGVQLGGYFDVREWVEEWTFEYKPEPVSHDWPAFRVPYFQRTLSEWINGVCEAGFTIERACEPQASEESIARCPPLRLNQVLPLFFQLLVRKSSVSNRLNAST